MSESESDGEAELEATFSSMKQPPLIKQLKGILSEYPDGGQIIKELIQNAEDAGANEVRILYDGRRINREVDKKKKYRKFFQGPALCVYNDATFTETDWEGIQMIYSSVKEDDPLKVGRFGLGFKSVFHITDHPCVISGNSLLLIDPQHQRSDRVNAMMRLNKLERYTGMDIDAFLEALGDAFGIDRDVIKSGQYKGTVFWFPLREAPSALSETLYDEKKVKDLFDVFKCEADSILIFLRSLTSVSLNRRGQEQASAEVAKVELVANIEEIKKKREEFQSKIKNVPADYNGDSIQSLYTMTVRTFNCGDHNENSYAEATWMVVNYFMGGNASPKFRALIKDPNLGYSPFVGVAMPLSETQTFVGHVFCFLPLPKEGKKLTGLPVHVNGFFALNQSRHHLKWATDEQTGKKIDDKSILWNETLITEALPLAYAVFVQSMVQHSENLGNTNEAVNAVYNATPDVNKVTPAWTRIVPAVFDKLKSQRFLFYRDQESSGKSDWIGVHEACFATVKQMNDLPHARDAIVKVLLLLQQKFVDVPDCLFDVLSYQYGVNDLSPRRLSELMHQNTTYGNSLADADKFAVLEYLLYDKDYGKINGLELLPLESGTWSKFQSHGTTIFMCSEDEKVLFPGLESTLLRKPSYMPEFVGSHFKEICTQGICQLKTMTNDMASKLIKQTMDLHLGSGPVKIIRPSSTLTVEWLRKVWTFITSRGIDLGFRDVPLVPLLKHGTWADPKEIELLCPIEAMLLKQHQGIQLPKKVCDSMQTFSVKMLPSLPDWIPKSEVGNVLIPSPESILTVLSSLCQSPNKAAVIASFNKNCSAPSRDAFTQYLRGSIDMDTHAKQMLKHLKIFVAKQSPTSVSEYVSVAETASFIRINDFPVRYPRSFIDANQGTESLLRTLGATEISRNPLILETMNAIQQGKYNQTEVILFMEYFVRNVQLFEADHTIMTVAKDIPFLRTSSGMRKASELFNPDDTTLQDLFVGEPRFPDRVQVSNPRDIYTLKCLGLKDIASVNADHIHEVALMLDKWSRSGAQGNDLQRKARAFLGYLNRYPSILSQAHNYDTLANRIKNLDCILYSEDRMPSFPLSLPWYSHPRVLCKPSEVKDASKCQLVGSTMPVIADSAAAVSGAFGWNHDPPVKNVLDQLAIVKEHFQVNNQTDSLIIVKAIYQFMERNRSGIVQTNLMAIKNGFCMKQLIWNGEGFSEPKHIIVSAASQDIDLRPYFYTIPEEFHAFHQLFHTLDCHSNQTVDVLKNALSYIERKYQSHQGQLSVRKDMMQIGKILTRLAERKEELNGKFCDILIPIEDDDYDTIIMKHVDECVYDKDPQDYMPEEGEDPVFIVHSEISLNTAKVLGVRSLNRKALSDTEELGFEAWGQTEPLTTRIHTLLKEGYMDGLSVPKELIQNADDAGATTVKFLYDERTNEDAKIRLLSSGMGECQGPALWVFNNATFTKDDLENIAKLNGATKAKDASKIGKFGLGFCSVYNLTDVPSFVSGNNIVIFDPHMTYLEEALPGNSPGLKIDLSRPKNRSLLRRHSDQFKPFQGIFGCDVYRKDHTPLEGTLFRFPLRTFEQSQKSSINAKIYSRQEVQELLQLFINAVGNFLLFTQNVHTIEVFHLPSSATSIAEQTLLFSARRDCYHLESNSFQPVTKSVLSRISKTKGNENFQEIQKRDITLSVSEKAKEVIPKLENVQAKTDSSWIISWASGTKHSLALSRSDNKYVFPLSAVGIPCGKTDNIDPIKLEDANIGFYQNGHIFCFLPLPLATDLQMHVNGYFDITSDRRQLLSLTEDDKGSRSNQWNEALMSDAMVNALLHLLIVLTKKTSNSYVFHSLWPTRCGRIIEPFKRHLFRSIVDEDCKVFKSQEKWASFQDVVFINPDITKGTVIGPIAFEFLTHFRVRNGEVIVEMPEDVLYALLDSNSERPDKVKRAMIDSTELLIVFLANIQDPYWEDKPEARDAMILFALESENDDIKKLISENKSIPAEPHGTLCFPSELVHPECDISSMFHLADGRFPAQNFRESKVLQRLVNLGMNTDTMPGDMLVERCSSIDNIAKTYCCECAFDRIGHVLKYLNRKQTQAQFEIDKKYIDQIQNMNMLPVLACPEPWTFSWKADTCTSLRRYTSSCDKHSDGRRPSIVLGKAVELFRQSTSECVGLVESVVDESRYKEQRSSGFRQPRLDNDVYMLLGVKGSESIPVNTIVEQIKCISDQYIHYDLQYIEAKRMYEITFSALATIAKEKDKMKDEDVQSIKTLFDAPVILIGKDPVLPCSVAYKIKEECPPDLHQLPNSERLLRQFFYDAIGVKEHFSFEDVVNVLNQKHKKWGQEPCEEIETVNKLLTNLEDCMKREGKTYKDYESKHPSIVAADIHGILWPTYDLVIDDEDFETSESMKLLHKSVPPLLAEQLGVKTKERKCFADIAFGIPFGQKEKLVSRLHGLLKAYPCDSGIMKELLQNADDANATEIHFIKDYRTHSTKKIYGQTCTELQGPSLCVFNNSYFTEEDLEGIHNLGQGSKGNDPTKTGQYGVGFNAVYHMTDTPSFLTKGPNLGDGGVVCIFDPLCTHIPDVKHHEPGVRCNVDKLKNNFPDVLSGFLESEDIFQSGKGTIFRFPLRTTQSKISNNIISEKDMDKMLNEMKDDMFEALLFVKNIKCIKISDITSGTLQDEYSVCVSLSGEDILKREQFFKKVKAAVDCNENNRSAILKEKPFEVCYGMTVKDTRGKSKRWCIVQRFGFDGNGDVPEPVVDAFRDNNLGNMPIGGVGMLLPTVDFKHRVKDDGVPADVKSDSNVAKEQIKTKHDQFKAFSFLPLPIVTGLPVHINGHFALDHEARRELWKEGYRKQWNECLIRNVIVHAYVTAIKHMRTLVVCDKIKTSKNMNTALHLYHSSMPVYKDTGDGYWKLLAAKLYVTIVQTKAQLFPVVISEKIGRSEHMADKQTVVPRYHFKLQWVAFGCSGDIRLGCFNTICNPTSTVNVRFEDRPRLEKLFKHLGMKILDTPPYVYKSMVDSGVPALATSCPDSTIAFMKTFKENTEGCCDIGGIDKQLSLTKIANESNLCLLIQYLSQGSTFLQDIINLPVLLTRAGVLRLLDTDNPVIHSKFGWLLPASADMFIHDYILYLLPRDQLLEKGLCSSLTVPCFEKLLSKTLASDVFAKGSKVQWDADSKTCPNAEWIIGVWTFLIMSSEKFCDETKKHFVDTTLFTENINMLSKWSLLPCVETNNGQTSHLLISTSRAHTLINLSSFYLLAGLYDIVKKLQLPSLNSSVFMKSDCYSQMVSLVPSYDTPCEVLNCLQYHKSRVASSEITNAEATELLKYFSNQLDKMKASGNQTLVKTLCSLPLYITHQGFRIDLDTQSEVLVLPDGMPVNGMHVFAEKCGIILLKQNAYLQGIFDFLSLNTMSIRQMYTRKILPSMHDLPQENWEAHIAYIRDNELSKNVGKGFDTDQGTIIAYLTNLAFLSINGRMVKCSDLFCHEDIVFATICDPSVFPPERFRSAEWMELFKLLGMHVTVTDELMVTFAQGLGTEGAIRVSEDLRRKSVVLVEHFIQHIEDWNNETINNIGRIKYVVAANVPDRLTYICNQNNNCEHFICFHESVSTFYKSVCWSTCVLLQHHQIQSLSNIYLQRLGVHEKPPFELVLNHCQNMCCALEQKLKENETIDSELVSELMIDMYTYLQKNMTDSDVARRMLQPFPIVYLPDENKLVTVNDIVIDILDGYIVKPYLYKAPAVFGLYHRLFVMLGTSENVECFHYVRILMKLFSILKHTPVPANMLNIAKFAIRNLCRILKKPKEPEFENQILYLPNTENILVSSQRLIVANNRAVKDRLSQLENIEYFAGFIELGITDVFDPVLIIRKIPKVARPKLLTDIVKEVTCLDEMEVNDSAKAMEIQSFLHSNFLLEGVCRIIKHQLSNEDVDFDTTEDVTRIKSKLQSVRISEVSGLKTYLHYNGNRVDGSGERKRCFIEQKQVNDNGVPIICLYFEDSIPEENGMMRLFCEKGGLVELLGVCTDHVINKNYSNILLLILDCMNNPERISNVLDSMSIDPLDLVHACYMSAFPRPGILVEPQFYPFLEQSMTLFEEYEYSYVALEVEDQEMDDENNESVDSLSAPVYKYAHILRELNVEGATRSVITTKYVVNAGDQNGMLIEVPAYRLYRFVKRVESPSEELVLYDAEPVGSILLDETCQRIREMLKEAWRLPIRERKIIRRRLLTRWHPDRNRAYEEYASRVFNYVKEIMLKLDRQEELEEDITNQTGRTAPDISGSYLDGLCRQVERRANKLAAAYYHNYPEYVRRGHYVHLDASMVRRPDPDEAKRWIRQAKIDYRTAESSLSLMNHDVPGYNWTCYICHQACEKALKAARYSNNANDIVIKDHSLTRMAGGLSPELVQQASRLENDAKLGKFNRMRYPDSQSPPDIPSDIYTLDDAKVCLEVAKAVIEKADEYIH